MISYKELCFQVCDLAKEVGKYIKNEQEHLTSNKIEVKGMHDFVTYVDKTSEQKIVAHLQTLLPDAGFIAEENTRAEIKTEFNWIIDPLDGTTNFIHGLPIYAISIALMQKEEVVLGVVYEIGKEECFYAWKDSPAFLNEKIITVSDTPNLDNSLLATGFPFLNFDRLPQYMKLLSYTMEHTSGLRRLGSAATDLAYVACGRVDGFYEYGLKPWDVAAGSFIVQQAGGCNCDFSGKQNYVFGQEIISSNAKIFQEFKHICSDFLNS